MKKQFLLLFFQISILSVLNIQAQTTTASINLNFQSSSDDLPVIRAKVYVVQEDDTIASGFSDEAGIFSFETDLEITGVDEYFVDQQELSVSPNPVTGNEVIIRSGLYALNESESQISIYDVSGKVYSENDHFPPGSYILSIKTPGVDELLNSNFIISRPGHYHFRLDHSNAGDGAAKKAAANEGTPFLVVAEKSEFVNYQDTVYLVSTQENYELTLTAAEKPTPLFSVSGTRTVGETIFFDGSGSVGATEEALKYTWNFGDGGNSGGEKTAHIYTAPGTYDVYLTATGNYGAKDTLMQTIEISAAAPPSDTALISAFVRDPDGQPIEGAMLTVSGMDEDFTTDAQGEAELHVGVETDVAIRVTKEGYTSQVQYVHLKNGSEFGDHYFTLTSRESPATITEAEFGFEYASARGVKVSIPVEGLVDQNGAFVTGDVDLYLTPVDVSDRDQLKAFPGEFSGITPEGDAPVLMTYGVAEYIFEQDGNKLQLNEGKVATIEIPVFITTHQDGTPVVPGDQSPLWSLDEQTGRWVEEGTGTVVESENSPTGLALRAEVSHFSWWNHDIAPEPYYPIPECKINDESGLPTLEIPPGGSCYIEGELAGPNGPRNRPSTLGGGSPLPVPPDQDMWLFASGGNGVYQGKVKINGPAGIEEVIIIPLDMIYSGGDGDLIEADTLFDAALETVDDVDTYTFNVIEGTAYNLGVGRGLNSNLSGAISLYDGAGNHIQTSGFGDNGFNFSFIAEENDTYTVEIRGTENVPGAYRVSLEIVPVVSLDSNFEVATFFKGQVKKFLFAAQKDQIIYPYVSSQGSYYFRVLVKDPNGNAVLNSNGRYVNTPGYHTIVADGMYTFEIVSSINAEKNHTVGLATIGEPASYPVDEEISVLSDSIGVYGKPYFFRFEGKKDDVINYALHTKDSLSAYYILYSPGEEAFYNREQLRNDNVVNFHGNASGNPYNDRYRLPEDGEYIFKVQAGRTQTRVSYEGKFSLYLFRPDVTEIVFDSVYNDSIKTPYNFKRYSFKLDKPTSSSMVYTNMVRGGYLYAYIYDKNGDYVANTRSNVFTGSITYGEIAGFYLDSLVYIEFNPSGGGTGRYDFNIVENEDPVEVQSDIPWHEFTGEISQNGEIDYYKFTSDSAQVLGLSYIRGDNALHQKFSVYKAGEHFATGDLIRDDWYSTTDRQVDGKYHQFTAEIPSPGEYIIRVNGNLAANIPERATGEYTLRLNLLDKASSIVVDDTNIDNQDATTGFIRSAIRAVGEGGNILVEPGEYTEIGSVIVNDENVTLTGADSSNTHVELISNQGFDVKRAGLTIRDIHFINSSYQAIYLRPNIPGFLLENARITGGQAVDCYGGNHNTVIRNNTFESGASIGINLSGDGMIVENNALNSKGGSVNSGMSIRGTGNIIRNNVVGSADARTISFTGILVTGDSAVIEDNLINTYAFGIEARSPNSNNVNSVVIRNNTLGSLTGSNGGNSDGIIVSFVDNAQVYNNNITGHPDLSRGIRMRESGGNIYNNRIRINRFDGIYINTSDGSPELVVANNTIIKTGSYRNHANIKVLNGGTTSPVRILNNIMVMPETTNAEHYAVYSQAGIIESDYNLFDGHTAYYTSNLALGPNDVTADPVFADDALRLDASSPAIDAGTGSFAPSEDFEGTTRPSGPGVDIGAHEF